MDLDVQAVIIITLSNCKVVFVLVKQFLFPDATIKNVVDHSAGCKACCSGHLLKLTKMLASSTNRCCSNLPPFPTSNEKSPPTQRISGDWFSIQATSLRLRVRNWTCPRFFVQVSRHLSVRQALFNYFFHCRKFIITGICSSGSFH